MIGCGGAGKTTVAKALAAKTGLPLIHLDRLFWHPGWVPTPDAEWDRVVADLIARDRWILDGNYGRTLPMRLAACDTVVFLDMPTRVSLWRAFKRQLQYRGRTRPDLADGCPEQWSLEFLQWIWTYRRRRRPEILRRLAELANTRRIVILRSETAVRDFLASL